MYEEVVNSEKSIHQKALLSWTKSTYPLHDFQ